MIRVGDSYIKIPSGHKIYQGNNLVHGQGAGVITVSKQNNIPHRYAVAGTAFSFAVPSSTFLGSGLTYTARLARDTEGISLDDVWLDFDPVTRTFSGTPSAADFTDEATLQIEVSVTDVAFNTAKAYFTIVVYPSGSTCTTVLPRTAAECNHVITSANKDSYNYASIVGGETVGFVGDVGRVQLFKLRGTYTHPILSTNVDGVATCFNEVAERAIYALNSDEFKIIGQYVEATDDIYGFKCHTGVTPANKSDEFGVPLSDTRQGGVYDYVTNNTGGTAIEIAGSSRNGFEIAYVDVPYSASAGIKVRTEAVRLEYTANGIQASGAGTVTINQTIPETIPDSGWISVGGDNYEFSSWAGSTFTLVGTLSMQYADTAAVHTCTGIRGFHDMSRISIHDCLLQWIDTESIYAAVGFYGGRADSGTTLIPHDISKVRVLRNIVLRCGWDGVQVKCTKEDTIIRDNYIYYTGHRLEPGQAWGLYIEGLFEEVSRNTIRFCQGTGIRTYLAGPSNIFNNVIEDCGLNEATGTLGPDDGNYCAFYGSKQGYVIDGYSQNEGGYVLSNYISRPDLGTVHANLDVYIVNNTVNGCGNTAYEIYNDMHIHRGNNLFVNGGSVVTIGGGATVTNEGGDLLNQLPADVDFYDAANGDYRIQNTSVAAGAGVNLTAITGTKDFNRDAMDATYDTGAFIVDGTINKDNYIYV